jgi:oligosaccharide repeat unit polymerase
MFAFMYVGRIEGLLMFTPFIYLITPLVYFGGKYQRRHTTLKQTNSLYQLRHEKLLNCLVVFLCFSFVAIKLDFIIIIADSIIKADFFALARDLTSERYSNPNFGLFALISNCIFFTLFGLNAMYKLAGRKHRLFDICLLLMLLIQLAATARAGVMLACTLGLSFYLSRVGLSFNWIRSAVYVTLALLFALIILSFVQWLRFSHKPDWFLILLNKIPGYTIRTNLAFFTWLASGDCCGQTMGLSFFGFISKYLGKIESVQGFYYARYTPLGSTNIFTNLRGMYNDFGLIGVHIVYFALGTILGHWSVLRVSRAGRNVCLVIIWFLLFPFISPFAYTTSFVSFCLLVTFAFVFENQRLQRY